ncbi:MAG: ABC transporter ATP-binding protein [Fastidiosipilaceae bacterium]|jgi:ABC-2 type transport system ATP-binding protein
MNKPIIETQGLSKRFGDTTALNSLNNSIFAGSIYGLVGSNGAGKSTFLRILAGIYRQTEGTCLIYGRPIYDQPDIKEKVLLVPDTPSFIPQSSLKEMRDLYARLYPNFNENLYRHLSEVFRLNPKTRLKIFSRGMQRQAELILAISTSPDLLLLDEAFDGLDPVMRQVLKRILAKEVADRGLTVIISSHNLRELEDFCDNVGLLHRGGIIFEQELDGLKLGLCKIQVAYPRRKTRADYEAMGLNLLSFQENGSIQNLVVKGNREQVTTLLEQQRPLVLDVLPLTLEEIFIQSLEVKGYDVNNILN